MGVPTYYTITSIIPKSGKLACVHKSILGRNCIYQGLAHLGQRVCLLCDVENDPVQLHRILTSELQNIMQNEFGGLVLQTENTTYVLSLGNDPIVGEMLYNKCPTSWLV